MVRRSRLQFLLLLSALFSFTQASSQVSQVAGVDQFFGNTQNKLWYRQPAANWNEALPIGNGRLAAMVFGGPQSERIQLNEDTIWAGEKRDRNNPEGAGNLAEVRRLLFAGKPKEAEVLAERTMIAVPKRMPPYQPLGDLLLRFSGQEST